MLIHKDLSASVIITGIVLIVIVSGAFVLVPNMLKPTINLWLGDGIFRTRVASNNDERTSGLLNLTKLEDDQAFLMVFPNEDKWSIAASDIKAPVDIIWLDSGKKVVYIVKKVQPDPSEHKAYVPKNNAKYIVQLTSGTSEAKKININSSASFQIDSNSIK